MTEAYYFAAINGLRIAQHQDDIEDNEHYQVIRDEINARLRGPDWHKVKQHAEKLGREAGFGLLAAAYYTVAAAQTEGISGLADGLEITLTVLLQPGQADKSTHPATLNTLNWMANRLIDTVKQSETSRDLLRNLYRCERACLTFQHSVDAEVIGLQTVHSLVCKKIRNIEKQVPEMQTQAEKSVAPAKRNGVKKFLLLLLASIIVLVLTMLVKALLKAPENKLAEQTVVPRVLNGQQVNDIQQTHGMEKMQQHKARIMAMYLHEIRQRLHQGTTENFQQAEKLLHTLGLLYPDEHLIDQEKQAIQAIKLAQQENLADLSERFKKARTDMANLSRAVQQLASKSREVSRLKAIAKDLESYAISLSPLLGRSFYIEENLQQNNTQIAQQELAKLDQQVKALALKVGDLKKVLKQRLAAEDKVN